MFKADCS